MSQLQHITLAIFSLAQYFRHTGYAQVLLFIAASAVAGNSNAAAPGLSLNLGDGPGAIKLAAPKLPVSSKASSQSQALKPRQFAVGIPTDITPDTAGSWQQLQDGRWLWRVRIESAGAKSLNFAFGHLRLPELSELYVYDAAGTKTSGPYSAKDHRNSRLWTQVIEGDAALVEVVVPAQSRDQLELQISQVNYGFTTLSGPLMGESASCQIDVACSAGDNWRPEARAVAVYTFGGQFSCSGTLINNTALDQTPYFLTAAHCIQTAEHAASTVIYWNYQASTCAGNDGNRDQSQSGADLVARSQTNVGDRSSDFSLLKLWQQPDPGFGVYYAGWDRRDVAPSDGVVGIHHPQGDEKKISTSDLATYIASIRRQGAETVGPDDLTHLWVPSWTQGVVEFGSSGSGLWNAQHRLVGHLTGGIAGCGTTDRPSGYGRLYFDWSTSTDPRYSIAGHLDPLKSGAEVLDGLDSIAPAPTIPSPADNAAENAGSRTALAEPGTSRGGAFALMPALLLGLASLIRKTRPANAVAFVACAVRTTTLNRAHSTRITPSLPGGPAAPYNPCFILPLPLKGEGRACPRVL